MKINPVKYPWCDETDQVIVKSISGDGVSVTDPEDLGGLLNSANHFCSVNANTALY